jgi:hypothetical protein
MEKVTEITRPFPISVRLLKKDFHQTGGSVPIYKRMKEKECRLDKRHTRYYSSNRFLVIENGLKHTPSKSEETYHRFRRNFTRDTPSIAKWMRRTHPTDSRKKKKENKIKMSVFFCVYKKKTIETMENVAAGMDPE